MNAYATKDGGSNTMPIKLMRQSLNSFSNANAARIVAITLHQSKKKLKTLQVPEFLDPLKAVRQYSYSSKLFRNWLLQPVPALSKRSCFQ